MIQLDGTALDLESLAKVAAGSEDCALSAEARSRMAAARAVIDSVVVEGIPTYGINTGFGELATVPIAPEKTAELQRRLLLSHAAGLGRPLRPSAVRAMLALRVNTLARGYSGIRVEVVERLLALLERGLLPVVPRRGSVGASGDLAPLAHLALPLIGEGELSVGGERRSAGEALRAAGLPPLTLAAKEGLALINGTQAMTSLTALAAIEARKLVRLADLVGALSLEALRGTDAAFDPRLHALRAHPGQQTSARNLCRLISGSQVRESHREDDTRVQDPYSLRCMPQVHGAVRDVLADVERRLEIEINSVTDNPLVFAEDGEVLSGGNFHGEPIAMAADFLTIALAELGSISERRIEKLTNPSQSGLPAFLVEDAGLNSGFMMAQVTAAALAAESKTLAHPASVDSIPTSADKEDHVSMGMGAALKLERVAVNCRRILAIEALAAAQGVDFHRPLKTSVPLEAWHTEIRKRVPHWSEDRWAAPDLETIEALFESDLSTHLEQLE